MHYIFKRSHALWEQHAVRGADLCDVGSRAVMWSGCVNLPFSLSDGKMTAGSKIGTWFEHIQHSKYVWYEMFASNMVVTLFVRFIASACLYVSYRRLVCTFHTVGLFVRFIPSACLSVL